MLKLTGKYMNRRNYAKCFNKILLRDEVKGNERRTALIPVHAEKLVKEGYEIFVEKSKNRIFSNEEYQNAGCMLVDSHQWMEDDGFDGFILGLKELPKAGVSLETFDGHKVIVPEQIKGNHIYFSHTFKYQDGWKKELRRFNSGGRLFDLEFLTYDNGARVAAFGQSAGFAGAAVGLMIWANQGNMKLTPFESKEILLKTVSDMIQKRGRAPSMLIVGAGGRCGQGATLMAEKAGLTDIRKWDFKDTAKGGPFKEMLDVDIVVNSIYAPGEWRSPPFLDVEFVEKHQKRKLSIVVDVSCDVTAEKSAFPLTKSLTSFDEPSRTILENPEFSVVAIDNLPTLVPKESSEDFGRDFYVHLSMLNRIDLEEKNWKKKPTTELERVWYRASDLFQHKMVEKEL